MNGGAEVRMKEQGRRTSTRRQEHRRIMVENINTFPSNSHVESDMKRDRLKHYTTRMQGDVILRTQ